MAATHLLVKLTLNSYTSTALKNFEGSPDISEVLDRLKGIANTDFANSGTKPQVLLAALENGTQASATVTCVTVSNNSTVVLGNVTLTGKTSSPSGQAQFLCGVSATADATALKACINAHTTLSTWFSASSSSGVVTITALDYDTRGNAYALTSSDGTNLAVTTFSGGALDSSSITVNA